MRNTLGIQHPLRALLAAVALVVCVGSGLAAGTFSRGLVTRLGGSVATQTTTQVSHGATQATGSSTPSPTPLPAQLAASGFTLTTTAAPNHVAAGQQFTVIATVVAGDGVTPVPGLTCTMRAPSEGARPLFQQWPAPQVTDAKGVATWTLTAPQVQPGQYAVDVIAYGQHGYWYNWHAAVTITS